VGAASAAAEVNRPDEAFGYVQKILALNPWRADYHQLAGVVHVQKKNLPAAAEASKKALALDPANIQARMILIECDIKMGRRAEALEQYTILLGYNPPDLEAIRRWYARLE
jgi:tetratricopeptide (TPR) repeat protein